MGGELMKLESLSDFSPGPGNPRNSEWSFLPLKDGRTLFMYSHFTQSAADDAAASLLGLMLDVDGMPGETKEIIPSSESGAIILMSLTLLQMGSGDIRLFYLQRMGQMRREIALRRSRDEGNSRSRPAPVTTRPDFFVINNDRVKRLYDGSIIVPAAKYKKMQRDDGNVYSNPRTEAVFFISEDDGRYTFKEMPGTCVNPYPGKSTSGLQEPGVMEMPDGHLWAWARTDLGNQWESCTPV